ncbi:MAG: hypothetical protein LBE07_03345 [Gordonia sp. (in: high G+C Gram-positive bacteria)]|jgi:hypothetical protein|nr:hypothetical protein [Gordonia sp. (in: high G+C Gram-positive bacteria)]
MLLNEGAGSLSKIARRRAQGALTKAETDRRSAGIAAAFTPLPLVQEAS